MTEMDLKVSVAVLDIADMGIINYFGYRVGQIKIRFLVNDRPEEMTGYYDPSWRHRITRGIQKYHESQMKENDTGRETTS